jgi:hypothetical protein
VNGSNGRVARWATIGLLALLVAACGGGSTPATVTPTVGPSTAPAAAASASADASPSSAAPSSAAPSPSASKGPATSTFALAGTKGTTGPVTANEIVCDRPSLDGPTIFYLGHSGSSGPQVVIFVRAGYVEVRLGTGSGTTLHVRSFEGSGVTGFDGATGATLDSTLTETTPAGTAIGDLGAVTSIKGSLDCGNETLGTSTVAITGETGMGTLGPLTDALVTCTIVSTGTFVGITSLTTAGTTPVLVIVTAGTASLQVAVETKTEVDFFSNTDAGATTMAADGASMSGDAKDAAKTGAIQHTIHVAGDATCGTTVKP